MACPHGHLCVSLTTNVGGISWSELCDTLTEHSAPYHNSVNGGMVPNDQMHITFHPANQFYWRTEPPVPKNVAFEPLRDWSGTLGIGHIYCGPARNDGSRPYESYLMGTDNSISRWMAPKHSINWNFFLGRMRFYKGTTPATEDRYSTLPTAATDNDKFAKNPASSSKKSQIWVNPSPSGLGAPGPNRNPPGRQDLPLWPRVDGFACPDEYVYDGVNNAGNQWLVSRIKNCVVKPANPDDPNLQGRNPRIHYQV